MLNRSSTAQHLLPQPRTSFQHYRQQVQQKTRSIFSKHSSRASERKHSAALFRTTSKTNHFFKPQSQQANYRDKLVQIDVKPQSALRPFTQSSGRCHRAQSPLSVIRARSKILSNESEQLISINKQRKNNFLRRGSSIDKAIINNILKSKLNQNISTPGFSYCDHDSNRQLIGIISSQIPKGIRDVVGVEEMIRMSHIFTGTQFKSNNITKKLKAALSEVKIQHPPEDEDNITLKSIKRW